jgi:PAS domain S-box-containing protein
MNWSGFIFLFPYSVSLAIAVGIGFYTWRRRSLAGAAAYSVIAFAQAGWILGFSLELISPSLAVKVFWDDVQWIAGFVAVLGYVAFASAYTGRKFAHPNGVWGLLLIMPAVSTALIFTDSIHGLVRPFAYLAPREPFPELLYEFTPLVWVMAVYSYGLTLAAIVMLADHLARQHRLYRIQTGLILLGCVVPVIGTALTLAGVTFGPYRDTFPITSAIGNVIVVWGLFRYRLFDIVPVAREAVVESMTDMVVVFDAQDRVVDLNPAMLESIGRAASEVIGQPASAVFSRWPDLVERYRAVEQAHTEISADSPQGPRHFDLRLSPLRDRQGRLTGRVVVLRDITQHKQAEAVLRQSRDELERRVQERTVALSEANAALHSEIAERKLAEAALRASEERYRLISTVSSDYMFSTQLGPDGELHLNWVAGAFESITGYTFEEYAAHGGWLAALHPDDITQDARDMEALRANRPVVTEVRTITKSGALRWVRVYAHPVWDEANHRLVGIYGAVQDITERKQAEEAVQHYTARLEILREIDRAILAARSSEEIVEAATSRMRQLVPCWRASVTAFDFQAGHVIALAGSFTGEVSSTQPGARLPIADTFDVVDLTILKQGQPFRIDDLAAIPRLLAVGRQLLAEGVRSVVCLPLRPRGELIGTLNLEALSPAAFSEEHVEIAREVADQLAIALQQARLLAETTGALTREQRLNEVARTISSALDLQTIIPNVVRLAVELVGAGAGSLALIAPDGATMTFPYVFNDPVGLDYPPQPRGKGLAWRIAETGAPMRLDDYAAHPDALPEWVEAGFHAFVGVPVIAGEACLGALGLFSLDPGQRFDARDLALVEAVGRQAGVAIQNAQLFEAKQRQLAELTVLHAVAVAAVEAAGEDALLEQAVRIIGERLYPDIIGVLLVDPQAGVLRAHPATRGVSDELLRSTVPLGRGIIGAVAARGQAWRVPDVRREPAYIAANPDIRSEVCVPLKVGERTIGVLNLESAREEAFSEADERLLATVAGQLAMALERLRAEAALQRALARMEILHEIDRAILAAQSPEATAQVALDKVRELVGCQRASVSLFDFQAQEALLLAVSAAAPTHFPAGVRKSLEAFGLTTIESLRGRQPHVVEDVRALLAPSEEDQRLAEEGVQAWLYIPLVYQEDLIGSLNLGASQTGPFDAEHIEIAQEVAAQIAITIQQARLFEATQRRVRELAGLHEIAQAFNNLMDVRETYGALAEQMARLIGAGTCFVVLRDADDWMRAQAPGFGISDEEMAIMQWRAASDAAQFFYHDYLEHGFMLANSLEELPAFFQDIARASGAGNVLAVPLRQERAVIGHVITANKPGGFSRDDARLLGVFASQAASVVQNARLFAQVQLHSRQTAALLASAWAISASLEFEDALEVIVQQAKTLLEADGSRIHLLEPDSETLRCVIARQPDEEQIMAVRPKLGQGYTGRVAQTGEPMLVLAPDPEGIGVQVPGTAEEEESLALVPLRWRGRTTGVMTVWRAGHSHPFTNDDLRLLAALAAHASSAIENARLFTETTEALAREQRLNAVAHTISGALDLPQLLEDVVRLTVELVGADAGSLSLLAPDGESITEVYDINIPSDLRGQSLPRGRGLIWQVIETRKPLWVADYQTYPHALPEWKAAGLRGYLAIPIIAGETCLGSLGLYTVNPGKHFTERNVALAESVGRQAGVAIQNARLFEAERTAHHQAEVLRAANVALTQTLDLEAVLETLLDYLSQLVPYDSANVALMENGSRATIHAIRGYERWTDPELIRRFTFEVHAYSILNTLITTRKSLLVPDTAEHPGWVRVSGSEYVRSWLGVPLVVGDNVIGLYSLDKAEPGFFTEAHVHLAEALAAQAVIAIQNARLFEQVRTGREQLQALSHRLVEVQEEERRHIARELHDEIGQTLTGLKLVLQVVPRLPGEAARAKLQDALQMVNELMERAHDLSLDLRPAMLDDLGLPASLMWLFERYRAQTGVHVKFEFARLEERLAPEVETAAYRIVQEALTNVARHARVKEAAVWLLADENALRIQIQDEGPGFDAQAVQAAGRRAGVVSMKERAALLGGWLRVESAPGAGTQIIASLPLHGRLERRQHDRLNSVGG